MLPEPVEDGVWIAPELLLAGALVPAPPGVPVVVLVWAPAVSGSNAAPPINPIAANKAVRSFMNCLLIGLSKTPGPHPCPGAVLAADRKMCGVGESSPGAAWSLPAADEIHATEPAVAESEQEPTQHKEKERGHAVPESPYVSGAITAASARQI
jgi:hypothetical protein